MNSPSDDIKDMIGDSSIGLTFGVDLFVGTLPAQAPDNCAVIYDTPGYAPDLTFDVERYDRPSIQVFVRNNDYRAGFELIDEIKVLLHGLGHQTWNGATYEIIKCTQDPFTLGADEHNRHRWVCNFDIQRH